MVEILVHHLQGHVHAVCREFIGITDTVDYRYLHTAEYSKPVTFVGHQVVLGVVGDAEEVAAHILEKAYVAEMHLVRKGIAHPLVILMPVGAYEFEVPAVKEEALLRVEAEAAYSESISL